jgi:3-(3-hydroxy-phenyl)propionate hydroxylase
MGMNGGLHDAFNLAARLIDIIKHGASFEHEFIAYDRQRRCLAMRFVQEHTINNKKLMESRESDVQEKRQKFFMKSASDPILAKRFMMERSMIDSLRDSLKS